MAVKYRTRLTDLIAAPAVSRRGFLFVPVQTRKLEFGEDIHKGPLVKGGWHAVGVTGGFAATQYEFAETLGEKVCPYRMNPSTA